jgi:hypothetical protein
LIASWLRNRRRRLAPRGVRRLFAAAAVLTLGGALAIAARVPSAPSSDSALAATALEQALEACGKWRWDVKTLTDPAAKQGEVNFSPKWTSVKKLAALGPPEAPWAVAPSGPPQAFARLAPTERQAVLLAVRLTMAKKEPDGDIHLIVSSLADQTKELVVEFPTLNCTDESPKKQQMENAREKLLDACGSIVSAHWTDLHHVKAYISGVPFFDFGHGKGHPPNGAEIHPALGFSATAC